MTIGPAPMIRIEDMSVRFGMRQKKSLARHSGIKKARKRAIPGCA
jgi:hypothetical protein